MLEKALTFLRNEVVLCISFICACASFVATDNPLQAINHIDWRVIVLLFCLMTSVAGLRKCGVMARIAHSLVAGKRSKRLVVFALIMLPFFASMLVTNDVALLTFVPIAVIALETAGWNDKLACVIVLQAIAANLGGMITPIGNPQNLFIFTSYELSTTDFLIALAPFGALAFVILALVSLSFGKDSSTVELTPKNRELDAKRLVLHLALFLLCLLSVVRLVPYLLLLPIVILAALAFDRSIFAKVDYALLATFVCFFIFSGNIASMPVAQTTLGGIMATHPMLTSLLTSQVISNVPSAVLLSSFTENWHSLLIGVDIGGLGTPVASLASLIAYKLYIRTYGAKTRVFMRDFLIVNIAVLACMLALYAALFAI